MAAALEPPACGAGILVACSPGEQRTALLVDGVLTEAWVERPFAPDGVGDLHRGRVSAVAPAMAGAFVALPGGETGFLPESAAGAGRRPITEIVSDGTILGLRVTRAAQGGKGPRLSARLTEAEAAAVAAAPPGAPRLVARGPDAPARLAARHPRAPVWVDGAALATRLRGALGERVRLVPAPVFDDTLEAAFDILAGHEVPLPGGGRLLVHPTPALTAIDMDAGSAAGSRNAAAVMAMNREALPELVRQIRLRNLAGAILVDVAGLAVKRREALAEPLAAALAADPQARFLGFTRLGLAEIQRERVHPPLHEVLGLPNSPLTRGLAALRRLEREAAALPGRHWAIRAQPAVVAALRGAEGVLAAAGESRGRPIPLVEDAAAAMPVIEEAADE